MEKVKQGRGYVYAIQYHLVWCVKDRRNILEGTTEQSLKVILTKIALDNKLEIILMETNNDHVHLVIGCSPQHSIPNIIKALKGVSGRMLLRNIPDLKERLSGGSLWNPSYFVATASAYTEEQIKQYIQNQKQS